MQGQRGAIGSLPDSINFEYESLTTNLDMDPQICWNDLRNSSENTSMGNISQEGQTLTRWNTVGSSSSGSQNLVGQIGWSPPVNTSSGGNIVSQPIVNLNLNADIVDGPTFVRGSGSGSASQNFDLNEGRFHRVGNDNSPKPIGYDSKFHHMSGSSSGSGVFPVEDNDGSRPLDGRRVSCKRKTLEGNVGQSSSGNGGNFFSRAEASMWRPLASHFDASSSMNIAETPESSSNVGLPEEVNPRLGLGIGGGRDYVRPLNVSGGPERSHRNYRLRMSSSVQQDSLSNNSFLPVPVSATRHSDIPPAHQPLRFVPMNPPIDLMAPPIPTETAVPQNQSVTYGVPSQRNVQAHRWNSFRSGISSSSSVFGEADDAFPDGSSSRSLPRNIGEHPVFAPPVEARSLASHPTLWTGSGTGGTVISRNIGSSSRSRSHPRSIPSAGPSQDSHRPTQYSRRLSEYVRRSLLPTGLPEVTGQSSSSQQQSVPASSQDGVLPASGGSQGQSHSHSRSALWLERQADGTSGIPYLRALAAAGEGRSRIVSEIRNALNSIRRGEGLRIEDLMLLDQSIYFGRAEIHDQHRDMRLDVDNMSYEELLALEERIGNVCTGLTEETIVKCLKERKHVQTSSNDQTEAEPCCVCQETYKEGEYIGTLDCGHDFHKDCIKQWLSQKNLCPICKTTGLATK
ncbi:putative E3 ubiquitin-protein ligase RHG1A [Silene latifolia]|uniref:putative E3 ubiquitin-protein ligase RHG1A n=1 Tax=Silene latifolia TaxID=37657 RepID=UPI003D76A98A